MRPEAPEVKHPFTLDPEFFKAVNDLHVQFVKGAEQLIQALQPIMEALKQVSLDNKPHED